MRKAKSGKRVNEIKKKLMRHGGMNWMNSEVAFTIPQFDSN
jgi:hypothetical protein